MKMQTGKYNWGYKESFLVAINLLLAGFILEMAVKGRGLEPLHWPLNLVAGIIFLIILITFYLIFRKSAVYKWLSGIPAAVGAISLFCLLSLLLGFLPQNVYSGRIIDIIGLTHIQKSWPFFISGLYLLVVLGLVTIRRLTPLNRRNIGFFLNHAGLWLTIFAMVLGSGDLYRLKLKLTENEAPKDWVVDQNMHLYRLPFQVKLLEFDIEEYPPKIALVSMPDKKLASGIKNNLTMIKEGHSIKLGKYEVEVVTYFPSSIKSGNSFVPSDSFGAGASAFLKIINTENGQVTEGWAAPAILNQSFEFIPLDSLHAITLAIPEAKIFSSEVEIYEHQKPILKTRIQVNKPLKHKGWKLYQQSYEESMGRWSPVSILEAVYDPWLPAIYIGFFMLLAGSVYLLWTGRKSADE